MASSEIEIPMDSLSREALLGLIDEFILREGTDYGHKDWSLEEKQNMVLKQLEAKRIKIYFDQETESCTLIKP